MIKAVSKDFRIQPFRYNKKGVVKNHLVFVLDIPFCMNGKFVDLLLL